MKNRSVQFTELLIKRDASIRAALSIMDRLRVANVFVVEAGGFLSGVVAEDDIRKALLGGHGLGAPIYPLMKKPRASARPLEGRVEVLDLMRALRLHEVPVLDRDGRVVGVHVENHLVGVFPRASWAVIMAGGRGTRLAPLTNNIPKPMLPVAGRPILERLVLHLVGSGINKIFLSVNYLADMIEKHFGDGSQFGCTIEYLREDPGRPLGTGGALRLLGDLGYVPNAPLLVMNGDLITNFSVDDMLDAHTTQDAMATMAVSEYEHQVPFGVLEASNHRLVRIVEKPTSTWSVNAGIYVVEPSLLKQIPDEELFPITKLFDGCLLRGETVTLWPLNDQWQDVGMPLELAQARGQV